MHVGTPTPGRGVVAVQRHATTSSWEPPAGNGGAASTLSA